MAVSKEKRGSPSEPSSEGNLSAAELVSIVEGGATFWAPTGVFSYVAEDGKKRFWEGEFTVSSPDIIKDLEYYVEKGFLKRKGG